MARTEKHHDETEQTDASFITSSLLDRPTHSLSRRINRMRLVTLISLLFCSWIEPSHSTWSRRFAPSPRVAAQTSGLNLKSGFPVIRGGETPSQEDEERYSRQVYSLGARAHGLIRSSTVYLDGSPSSGLLFECAKNLALSGVRKLVIVLSDDSLDNRYHNAELDDLGQSYQRAARAEIRDHNEDSPEHEILVEYLKRLNPSILVSTVDRSSLKELEEPSRGVILCVDRPFSTQVSLNRLSRELNLAFVAVETAGVFGRVFCDFGQSFEVYDADGETPLVTPLDRVEDVGDGAIVVHCVEGEKHDVSKGDTIEFQRRNGSLIKARCIVTDVQNPFRFIARLGSEVDETDAFLDQVNSGVASLRRVKIPQHLSFEPIESAIELAKSDDSLFTPCDLDKSFDSVRRGASLSCFQAMASFIQREDRFPTNDDMDEFWPEAQASWTAANGQGASGEGHCMTFLRGCAAKFTPLQAVFGAIGAQETLKAATGLYYPTRQFLLYDCDEVMAKSRPSECESVSETNPPCCTMGLRHILGHATVEKLQAKRIFVVGAGAIGCELLKSIAAMGIGTGKKGRVILTDMDTIEKSNLSRQLLFRDDDIGKFKSSAAQEAALRFNPSLKLEVHSSKVGDVDHGPFNEDFWSKRVDIVLNALDNVDARLYIDGQCVSNEKALVDAGTMGPKGNVQVVVPHESESYASSVDPPEQAIAVCTLKNFPYAISHTIQWGRDLFDGFFQRRPNQANSFFDSLSSSNLEELASKMIREQGEGMALLTLEELSEDIIAACGSSKADVQSIRSDALRWAGLYAHKLFSESVLKLFKEHPIDSVDEDGESFWSGTRRPPRMLAFSSTSPGDPEQDAINRNLIEFVRSAARLRLETLLADAATPVDTSFTVEDAVVVLGDTGDVDSRHSRGGDSSSSNQPVAALVLTLRDATDKFPGYTAFTAAEFEKDDESNGHVDFVNAASNLRAIAYGIPPVDSMETRRVAGNIVPAMITTTAFISGLSLIELIKLVQKAPLTAHRNAFVNLALPFFAFTMPLPAGQIEGLHGRHYTLWDRLLVKEGKKAATSGGLTMRSLIRRIKKQASVDSELVDVASVSLGPYLLFANFLHDGDESVLDSSVWELIKDAIDSSEAFDDAFSRTANGNDVGDDVPDSRGSVELAVVVEDLKTGEEIELPPVLVKRYKRRQQEADI